MNTFPLKISSPEGDLLNADVVKVSLRAAGGDMAVMAGHIPFVSPVKAGEIRIEFEDGDEKTAITDGGILTVSAEKAVLLSGSFVWKED